MQNKIVISPSNSKVIGFFEDLSQKKAQIKKEIENSPLVSRVKAKKQANKILRSLDEAQKIHSGEKQAKSFDDFLEEL